MKIIKLGVLALGLSLFSCGEEKTKEVENILEEGMFQIDSESISLNWTAYKTTEKKGVSGNFKRVNVLEYEPSKLKERAIDNVSFSIPVSSLFSNNEVRDWKLINLFFGVMDNTELISGTFHSNEGDSEKGVGVMDLNMNGKTCDLSYDYTFKGDSMFITTTLNLIDWNGQEAIDSLNIACYELHKGADGVSKTWTDVDVKASVVITSK